MISIRVFLIPLVWLVVLGGIASFISYRSAGFQQTAHEHNDSDDVIEKEMVLELTASFDAGEDPFALTAANEETLRVLFNGMPLTGDAQGLKAGRVMTIPFGKKVQRGGNELFVSALPSATSATRALRVRVLSGDVPIVDQTMWGDRGGRVSGNINFQGQI